MYKLLQMNTAIETTVDGLSSDFSNPMVIALGHRGSIIQLFVAIEKQIIPVQYGLVNAVCRMMQLYYVYFI